MYVTAYIRYGYSIEVYLVIANSQKNSGVKVNIKLSCCNFEASCFCGT
jgi:hypothetical protein